MSLSRKPKASNKNKCGSFKTRGSIITISQEGKKPGEKAEQGRNVVNNFLHPLPFLCLNPLPPSAPSSLLHTLFITADFPLAAAILHNPPTCPTPPSCIVHMRAGVCYQRASSFQELLRQEGSLSKGRRGARFSYYR